MFKVIYLTIYIEVGLSSCEIGYKSLVERD